MSIAERDLWPGDIWSEDVISPEEILWHQATLLEKKTNGVLAAEVVRHKSEDRIVLGFEVIAGRVGVRVRLFEVQHRLDFEYPAALVPPDEELPHYLRDRVYKPGLGEVLAHSATKAFSRILTEPGEWIENKWIASSPRDFTEKVQALLARPAVKAIVLSLLSRSKASEPGDAASES